MPRCCYLSTDDLTGQILDDDLTVPFMNEFGWEVEAVSWRSKSADWSSFDAVVIRSTWDYQREPKRFLDTLAEISAKTRLENPLQTVKWNLNKKYLREIGSSGVSVVPTVFANAAVTEADVAEWKDSFRTPELIIKPTVSANSEDTFRVADHGEALSRAFGGRREFMVQPFVPAIVSEGEFSLFYFGGEYSHTILKTPRPGDFRVQKEHGGYIRAVEPEQELLESGRRVIEAINPSLLYARVDLVRNEMNGFSLMELELIEPSLYFRFSPEAPKLFVAKFCEMMDRQ